MLRDSSASHVEDSKFSCKLYLDIVSEEPELCEGRCFLIRDMLNAVRAKQSGSS